MMRELPMLKEKDWSMNLEDEAYAYDPNALIADAVDAVAATARGHYVNLVTHAAAGHPEHGLIDKLEAAIAAAGITGSELVYIDECGCGGFVTRAYRR